IDSHIFYFFPITPRPPRSTLFRYTTLFRSNRNRGRQETNLAVAGLVFQLARNRDGFAVYSQEVAEFRGRGNLYVLPDAEFSNLRSEEHTSELQSRGHLVCRLLLEKKR